MREESQVNWLERARELGIEFAHHAARHDREGSFVADNFARLKAEGFLAMAIPQALGGGGASHAEACEALAALGECCGSTALALSMHTHLVAVAVYKQLHGHSTEPLLRRIVSEQLVLVTTGGNDWAHSNGELTRVDAGYLLDAVKPFASGSPVGDLLVTSAVYDDPKDGPQVLHFSVPFTAVGLHKTNDWDAHGMRGTGSQTLRLESVFIPDAAIQLRRRRQGWHASCSLVAAIAPAVYMSPYLGVARAAATIGRERARRIAHEAHVPFLLGEMETALFEAEIMHESLVTNAAGYDFLPDLPRANRALMAKSLMSRALLATVDKASALTGGAGFSRRTAIEQLVRDVRASEHHPLPDHKQHYFSGMVALGQSPA